MRLPFPLLACLVSASLALSGCSGDEPKASPVGPTPDPAAPVVQEAFTAQAPALKLGDHWSWTATAGESTESFEAIVVEDAGATWYVATTSEDLAKRDAAYGHPLLGTVEKTDLSGPAWGSTLRLLSFPLTDGSAYPGTMPNIAFDVLPAGDVALDMTATYVPELPAVGATWPGFRIQGSASGHIVVEADYVPAVKSFSRLVIFDIDAASDPGQDPVEVTYELTAAEAGWTGEYLRHEAELLLEAYDGSGFDNDPSAGGRPFVSPNPQASFTVADDVTRVYGFMEAFVVFGGREMMLQPPSGDAIRFEAVQPTGAQGTGVPVDVPALPGEWRFATVGAGGHSSGHVLVFGLREGGGSL